MNYYHEHNKKQNVIKKRWLVDYGKDLGALFIQKLKTRSTLNMIT